VETAWASQKRLKNTRVRRVSHPSKEWATALVRFHRQLARTLLFVLTQAPEHPQAPKQVSHRLLRSLQRPLQPSLSSFSLQTFFIHRHHPPPRLASDARTFRCIADCGSADGTRHSIAFKPAVAARAPIAICEPRPRTRLCNLRSVHPLPVAFATLLPICPTPLHPVSHSFLPFHCILTLATPSPSFARHHVVFFHAIVAVVAVI